MEKLAPSRYSRLMILPNYEEVTSLHKSNVVMVRDRSPPSWNRRLNVLVEYTVRYYATARVIKLPRKQRLEGKRTSCFSWKSCTSQRTMSHEQHGAGGEGSERGGHARGPEPRRRCLRQRLLTHPAPQGSQDGTLTLRIK